MNAIPVFHVSFLSVFSFIEGSGARAYLPTIEAATRTRRSVEIPVDKIYI